MIRLAARALGLILWHAFHEEPMPLQAASISYAKQRSFRTPRQAVDAGVRKARR